MTTFSKLNDCARPAARVVELLPSCFADDWDKKPSEAMRVGLRLVGEGDIERARAAAYQKAMEMIPEPSQDRVDQFNDSIMRGIIARATCMPEDAREPFFPMPEDDVQAALTDDAVKLLWHEYDVLKLESCGYLREATDDELTELAAMLLSEEAWGALTVEKSKRLRRIALHVLEELDTELRG
jgi:hypothetical protein